MEAVAMPETQETIARQGHVLIADDQPHILDALELQLRNNGFSTESVNHPALVLRALETREFDAVLMDLNYTRDTTGGREGLELVSQIRALDKLLPVVVMTAWGSVDLAVEAMQRGASDFVQKPWGNRQLLEKLQNQVSQGQAQRRMERLREDELEEASEIQAKLLPKSLPEIPNHDVAAISKPVRFVGGDYYNIVRVDDNHTAFCIADVAGKGMTAALLMSSLQAALQPLIGERLEPRELCQRVNRVLCELTPTGKFISLFYGVLRHTDHELTYCNAGHNPPLLVHANGSSDELCSTGAVLGQFPQWSYEQAEAQMKSGDSLLIFTDGLVEASNLEQDFFGEARLLEIVRENPAAGAENIRDRLITAAPEHCGGRFQDDASLIVLKAV
jgi:sigma-B regulation protein RsbU (phosphoserine phosphatase)